MKVSDYIAEFMVSHGVTQVFSVTGGGAMHLNDSFGHASGLDVLYMHHEQSCAMAAESYARCEGKPALVCVTTGPGGLNALNGIAGAYTDSVPMIVITGQVRYDTTVRSTGLSLRCLGDQETDIVRAALGVTKLSKMITKPCDIRYYLEEALFCCMDKRRGPCLIDIPLDIQAANVDESKLKGYIRQDDKEHQKEVTVVYEDGIDAHHIISKLKSSKRPVIYAGSAINTVGRKDDFIKLSEKLNVPVVLAWNSIDTLENSHRLYAGRAGIMGDRAGNFAVETSDFILSIGCRLSIRQVGYNFKNWAKDAYVCVCDSDINELKKPTIHADMRVCADLGVFIEKLWNYLSEEEKTEENGKKETAHTKESENPWILLNKKWQNRFKTVTKEHYSEKGYVNVYAFMETLSRYEQKGQTIVVGNGSACVVGSQAFTIKEGQRFIINSGMASMGYGIPAAIGAYMAKKEDILLITGDGSMQMNIQELATISFHRMPIRIFVINNGGYHSIRQTQTNFFGRLTGVGDDSFDIGFPELKKIAYAYDIDYYKIDDNAILDKEIRTLKEKKGPFICEVVVTRTQNFEPKSSTKKLEDGSLISSPLYEMAPFLPSDETKKVLDEAKNCDQNER